MMAMFKDQLTLDSMDRPQLVGMCQFTGLRHFGPDALLRWTLRTHLRQLRNDDKDILWEGVGSLTEEELRSAMRRRGMPIKKAEEGGSGAGACAPLAECTHLMRPSSPPD